MSTENKAPRDPFEFFQSPWWKDMSDKLCSDGWPQVVVSLNCFVRPAKEAYLALQSQLEDCKRKGEEWQGCAESLAVDNKNLTSQLDEAKAEIEQLKLSLHNANHIKEIQREQKFEAQKENARLREALRFLSNHKGVPMHYSIVEHTAREALKGDAE